MADHATRFMRALLIVEKHTGGRKGMYLEKDRTEARWLGQAKEVEERRDS
jgi:hypothetical protein